ncbi:TauD/TfdA family dioxygenase [Novosphingobium sp. Chol11]|uniref:TauD/TfdA family dioxygenase n=1 Tax=Novosphingobium sp. Chol11 TaxID=1385763 RepID=UPI0025F94FF1|nr:TauD/TfdA family dioxygenase [Novosphingobium sp. Chol11]
MARLIRWATDGAWFASPGLPQIHLTPADLIECAPSQFDPASGQRRAALLDLPQAPVLTGAEQTAEGWRFAVNSDGQIALRAADLAAYLDPAPIAPPRRLWLKEDEADTGKVDYQAYASDEQFRRAVLARVARQGWALLSGVPTRPDAVEDVVRRFGFIRETNYGRTFAVRSAPAASNLAFTDAGLAPHSDNPYRDPVPGLQLLHCLVDASMGGETRLVDGFAAAEALHAADPGGFAVLAATPVHFAWGDGANALQTALPVITLDTGGEIAAIRFNHRAFKAIAAPPEQRTRWRAAYRALAALIEAPETGATFRLGAGDLVIMDNTRVLHGRRAFTDDPGADKRGGGRHLVGAYADRDGLLSALAVLTGAEADRRLARIEALFASPAMDEAYGEALSIREHMLQTAALADEAELAPALVAAALLHDAGWALDGGAAAHEHSGADWLEDTFGSAVSEPVRLHVATKRYLVACEPDYAARLSAASVATLAQQGGPMTEGEAAAFAAMPGFAGAVHLRRCDDAAKEPARPAPGFADYRPLLRRLIAAHLNG